MSNLRRVKESKRSGKGTTDIYIPKWPLYERLKFLQQTIAQSTSVSNITLPSEKLDNMSQAEDFLNETQQLRAEKQEKEFIIESIEELSDTTKSVSSISPVSFLNTVN